MIKYVVPLAEVRSNAPWRAPGGIAAALSLEPSTVLLFDQVPLIGTRKRVKGLTTCRDEIIEFHNATSGR